MRLPLLLMVLAAIAGCGDPVRMNANATRGAPFAGEVLLYDGELPAGVEATTIGTFTLERDVAGPIDDARAMLVEVARSRGANGALVERQGHRQGKRAWSVPYVEGRLLRIDNYATAPRPTAAR